MNAAQQQAMDKTVTAISSMQMGMGKNSYICRGGLVFSLRILITKALLTDKQP